MFDTLLGIKTFVRPLQLSNVLLPMLVTLSEMAMFGNWSQWEKAELPIRSTLLGMMTLVNP